MEVFDDLEFVEQDFTKTLLPKGEYDSCRFVSCNFFQIDLSGYTFIDCEFDTCNLSGVKVVETGFQSTLVKNSKVLGVAFESCNSFLFALNFLDSKLDYSYFYKLNLTACHFENTSLLQVDFSNANLKNLCLTHCDLMGAKFEQTHLEQTDFRTAIHYTIYPDDNYLNQTKFSKLGLEGLLRKYNLEIT